MKIHKAMTNLEIAELLRAVAASYQIKDKKKNFFKITAYQRAADAIEHLSSEAKDLWDDGKLTEVAGIGESIAGHLGEIFKTGKSGHFKKVMEGLPSSMFDLLKIPGVGPKTAFKLAKELKISDKAPLSDLEKALKKGKLSKLEGLGESSGEAILKSIGQVKGKQKRLLLPYAEEIAEEIILWLKKDKSVKKADPLGSLRRKAATIGDVDIAVATEEPKKVIEHFCKYPKAKRIVERGIKTATILLPGERQVDLMVASPDEYGATLQHFTGSKHHNIALREYALKKGMSLSEYGIRKRIKNQESRIKKFETEEGFYKFLGMEWMAPELREDTGEIEAATAGKVPYLLELKDVKGDLQIHSNFDIETSHDLGESSMEEIIEKAQELGYEYIAFTEHNPSKSKHTEKQIIDLLLRKKEKIEQINYSLKKSKGSRVQKVFNSLEIDILPDGNLPVPEKGLETLDFALVSIHSGFRQSRADMTKRVLTGLKHPKAKILAHPTARKLNIREGAEFDWPEVFEFCKKNDKWLEINADPMRLDLPDMLVKDAVKAGVKLNLGTDAHHKDMLDNMIYGVYVARRGWAEKRNIVNTRSLREIEKLLEH